MRSDLSRRAAAATGISALSTFLVSLRIAVRLAGKDGEESVSDNSVRCSVRLASIGERTSERRVVNIADIDDGKKNIDAKRAMALCMVIGTEIERPTR